MDAEGLDQQEQDIRALEEWATRNEPLADTTKQEVHACIFFKNANKEQCGKSAESVEMSKGSANKTLFRISSSHAS